MEDQINLEIKRFAGLEFARVTRNTRLYIKIDLAKTESEIIELLLPFTTSNYKVELHAASIHPEVPEDRMCIICNECFKRIKIIYNYQPVDGLSEKEFYQLKQWGHDDDCPYRLLDKI